MFAIYSFHDLTYHYDFSLIKKGFPDYATAEAFLNELNSKNISTEYFAELVVCKELETHDNEESNLHFDNEESEEAYNELVDKYFGEK